MAAAGEPRTAKALGEGAAKLACLGSRCLGQRRAGRYVHRLLNEALDVEQGAAVPADGKRHADM